MIVVYGYGDDDGVAMMMMQVLVRMMMPDPHVSSFDDEYVVKVAVAHKVLISYQRKHTKRPNNDHHQNHRQLLFILAFLVVGY